MKFSTLMFDKELLQKYSTLTIISGVLMLIIGAIGVFLPGMMSIVVVTFLGWLFLMSAGVQAYVTFQNYRRSFSAWLKPTLLFIVGALLLFYPIEGIAATALLLVTYLLIDAYSSFGFALDYKPHSGWWLLIVNAIISILLAVFIMLGWPVSSIFWVGIYAAISLFFDGVALIAMGLGARKLAKEV